jgi:hypothetical protein
MFLSESQQAFREFNLLLIFLYALQLLACKSYN